MAKPTISLLRRTHRPAGDRSCRLDCSPDRQPEGRSRRKALVKARTARQSDRCLIEGCSTFLSHRYLISGFHEVRVLVPDAMSEKAGMLSRFISGRAFVPKEVPGRNLPDQVEIISLHSLQTPAIPGSSWISLDVVLRLSSSRGNPRCKLTGSWKVFGNGCDQLSSVLILSLAPDA